MIYPICIISAVLNLFLMWVIYRLIDGFKEVDREMTRIAGFLEIDKKDDTGK